MVSNVFQFTVIKPKALSIPKVRANILNALKEEGRNAVSDLVKTTQTWSNPPTMTDTILYKGGLVMMIAGPAGDGFNSKKWHWLNEGTKARYARMSSDWVSKTAPGRLHAGGGQGRVVLRGKRYISPNWARAHRIKARGWTGIINRKMRKTFQGKIQLAIAKGIGMRV